MRNVVLDIPYLMLLVVALMALLILALVVATVSVKTLRAARNRHYGFRQERVEPWLEIFLLEGESPELQRMGMGGKDRYLAPLMLERMDLLRGSDRERIAGLARRLGLVDSYLRDLGSHNRWRRARAAERLGYFGDSGEAHEIARILEDEDETVRAVAARALARIGSPEAVEGLARTLDNPSELTRLRVAENLDRVGRAAVPPLIALLEEAADPESSHQPDGPVFASRVLGGLRAREARPALRLVFRESRDPNIRAQAARALGMIGDTEDVPLLVEAAGDDEWPVRVQSANALGMIGEPSTSPVLEELVGDREWWARYAAASALANMGRSGEDTLIGLLDSSDPYARDRAAATLESRGITRRFVRQFPLESARGERARTAVAALAGSGITRHLHDLLVDLPDDNQKRALQDMVEEAESGAEQE